MMTLGVLAWLQSKLGYVLGAFLAYLGQRWWAKLSTRFLHYLKRRTQLARQKKAQEKLERDVQEGKPRTEEVRENEERWLNS